MFHRTFLLVPSVVCATVFASPALAQTMPDADDMRQGDIIVTGERMARGIKETSSSVAVETEAPQVQVIVPLFEERRYDDVGGYWRTNIDAITGIASYALTTARAKYPGMELSSLFLPTSENPVHQIWLRPAQTTVPARGNVEVIVDAKCGTILFSRGQAEMQAGDTVLTYLVELHNGRLLGLFGEGLIVLQGLALLTLPLAGMTLFVRRRGRRKASEKLRAEHQEGQELDPPLPATRL